MSKTDHAGKAKTVSKNLSFEKALERLQEIVAELEDPEKGLEASLELFEEGVGLSRLCRSRIDPVPSILTLKEGAVTSYRRACTSCSTPASLMPSPVR